jgi:hypothetical protein
VSSKAAINRAVTKDTIRVRLDMTASAKHIIGQDMEPKNGCTITRSKAYLILLVAVAVGIKHLVIDTG